MTFTYSISDVEKGQKNKADSSVYLQKKWINHELKEKFRKYFPPNFQLLKIVIQKRGIF